MTVPTTLLARKINPFFIYRSDDDPWTDDTSTIRRKLKDGDKKRHDRKKKKNIKAKTRFRCDHLRDFMHATSMHGLKYAAEKEASWIER